MIARNPVITGLGVVSAAGIGTTNFWMGLQHDTPRFREVSLFPTDDLPNHVAGEIGPWTSGFDRIDVDRLDTARTATFALAALNEAISDADLGGIQPDRVLVGTTVGDVADRERGWRQAARTSAGHPGSLGVDESLRTQIAQHIGSSVPVELTVAACAAGNMALIRAAQLIAGGFADVVICGGAETISRLAFSGFSRMRAMAQERCRPFSDNQDGMLLGEGSAFLIVESAAHATARDATVLATIAGYGLTCDAKHPAAPDPSGEGVARAMTSAIAAADPSEVDYVCAHGTGTPQNDAAEVAAYLQVFAAPRPPISSIKALIGHSLGAASAIEAVACALVITHQRTLPQWGLEEASTSHGVRPATGRRDDPAHIDLVLNNAFAFGGNNTCVGLRRPDTAWGDTTA
ncbi:beta-ketoacyl-[acyl-carrier-protein] synthase family protein [Amycolatopsis sp. NPDC059021]|uniref:beta-ketoacyl-[acyl-carrier-protein] synthase family protein n=1 Tax=Amycolatopsis sp. NPDC059021 TaxID=3346704 RepID=UPI0036700941